MTKESFLKLAQKLGAEVQYNTVPDPDGHSLEFLVFGSELDVDGYVDILSDVMDYKGFDIICDHFTEEKLYLEAVAEFRKKASVWANKKLPIVCCFLDSGWKELKFFERNGCIRVYRDELADPNRQSTFSCMIESFSSKSSRYVLCQCILTGEDNGPKELELIVTHNSEYLIMEN